MNAYEKQLERQEWELQSIREARLTRQEDARDGLKKAFKEFFEASEDLGMDEEVQIDHLDKILKELGKELAVIMIDEPNQNTNNEHTTAT